MEGLTQEQYVKVEAAHNAVIGVMSELEVLAEMFENATSKVEMEHFLVRENICQRSLKRALTRSVMYPKSLATWRWNVRPMKSLTRPWGRITWKGGTMTSDLIDRLRDEESFTGDLIDQIKKNVRTVQVALEYIAMVCDDVADVEMLSAPILASTVTGALVHPKADLEDVMISLQQWEKWEAEQREAPEPSPSTQEVQEDGQGLDG